MMQAPSYLLKSMKIPKLLYTINNNYKKKIHIILYSNTRNMIKYVR